MDHEPFTSTGAVVNDIAAGLTDEEKEMIAHLSEKNLFKLHVSLGVKIRSRYGL